MELEKLLFQPSDELRLLAKVIQAVRADFHDNIKKCFALKFEKAGDRSLQITLLKTFDNKLGYFDLFETDSIEPLTACIFFFKGKYQIAWSSLTFFTITLVRQDSARFFFNESHNTDNAQSNDVSTEEMINQGLMELENFFKSNRRSGAA